MSDNFNIYNFNGIVISYYKDIYTIIYILTNYYIKNAIDFTSNIYIITKPFNKNINLDFIKNKNIVILTSHINFDLFFNLHILRHDYLYKNNIIENDLILELYNKLTLPCNTYNMLNNYLNMSYNTIKCIKILDKKNIVYDKICKHIDIEKLPHYNKLLNNIHDFLNKNVDFKFDFKQYASMYKFHHCTQLFILGKSKNLILENVYYINKKWFDKDKIPLNIEDFNNDFEYILHDRDNDKYKMNYHFNSNNKDNTINYQEIKEEVMFLDYIYGFYNFGEFWDVIKRLFVSKIRNLPLFHMRRNRITNIQYYFDKLNFKFPTQYNLLEYEDKIYYFHKVHISTLTNTFRGCIEQSFAYEFNKLLNQNEKGEKTFNIYLARGNYGRSITNEIQLVNILKDKYNFIVLNGTETLEETSYYFTNSKVIIGAHGSLMKNIIWAKTNPVLIDLSPPTRPPDFVGNADYLGFLPIYISSESNDNEEIILNDDKLDNLYKLLDILCR